MTSTPTVPNKDFLKNLEEAILEHEIMACPNIKCNDKLVSKKKMSADGISYLEYQCLNNNCSYHLKRKIKLDLEIEENKRLFSSIASNKIILAVGIFMLGVFIYSGYQLFKVNNFIDSELQKDPTVELSKEKKFSSNDDAVLPK